MMISYYELLGMIKEGNNPEKIKYDDIIFNWCDGNYIESEYDYLNNYFSEKDMFDKNIEIIEEDKDIEDKIKLELINNNQTSYARQYRTFGTPIPKKDMNKFPVLEKYNGQDISYIVYESIDIL